MKTLLNFVRAMRANGVSTSIDDFGTGYSSLNLLKDLNVDIIKLDKSFLSSLENHRKNDVIVIKNIIKMVNELDMEVIAEGVETVKQAGANPCPPIVLGIGIGGSFDKCAALAKKALLRPLDQPNADPYYAALEKELLDAINATGFGPQGFGGATTCLGVCIEQLPTHVACLPVAVNVSCHVTRRASAEV